MALRTSLLGEVTTGDQLPELSYPVTATTVVLGALATRDWRPMHHDKDFAVNRNGTQDIFLNTPNQASWFERFVTDWTGPYGRLRRMTFRMLGSIFPGDTMVFTGTVTDTGKDETGCGWATSTSRCRSTVTRRPPARPSSLCRSTMTTIPGIEAATSGDHDRLSGVRHAATIGHITRRITRRGELTMLDLAFSPEQEMLRETVRGVCATTCPLSVVREFEDDPIGFSPSCGSSSPIST